MNDTAKLKARRRCKFCGGKIPPERRIDALYCKPEHKSAASRASPSSMVRRALSAPPPPPVPVLEPRGVALPAPAPERPRDLPQIVLDRLQQLRRDAGLAPLLPQPALAALALRQAAEALILLALRASFPRQQSIPAPDADDTGETTAMREMRRWFPVRSMTHGVLDPADLPRMRVASAIDPLCELVGVGVLVQAKDAVVVVILAPRPPADQPEAP